MISRIFVKLIEWNGIAIEVSYEPDWMPGLKQILGGSMAHLQVQSVQPERAALPITETGYRSHFLPAHEIVAAGGASVYVQEWLAAAARDPAWKAQVEDARQLVLL